MYSATELNKVSDKTNHGTCTYSVFDCVVLVESGMTEVIVGGTIIVEEDESDSEASEEEIDLARVSASAAALRVDIGRGIKIGGEISGK